MSVTGAGVLGCSDRKEEVHLPSHFAAYRTKRNSHSIDDCSSYDGDRPNSRLTVIESPCNSYDLDDDLSLVDLDSPELPDDNCLLSPTGNQNDQGLLFPCEDCFKCFNSPGKLRQHEYTHSGETPFECDVVGCDKKFTSKFKLKRHILIHSQTKTFTCDICNRAFRRKDHLKNHEKVHDPGKTVYSCSYFSCDRSYNSLSSFKKHQAMHSAEDGQLDCKICRIVLQNQDELMNHLKIHTGSRATKGTQDKKFGCNQCDKKFFTRKDLKRHSVVHTGNREFSCPHCSQRFGRKDHMTRHAKKTHQQLYEPERQRLTSTPGAMRIEAAKNSRKERSVSDPGPLHAMNFNPDYSTLRPLVSPNGVVAEFQKLGTADPYDSSSNLSYIMREKDEFLSNEDCTDSVYSPPPNITHTPISVIKCRRDQMFTIPEKIGNAKEGVCPEGSQLQTFLESSMESATKKYSEFSTLKTEAVEEEKKMETFSEDSNSTEHVMKEFLEEKDKIDFDSFIKEIRDDMFDEKPLILSPVKTFCDIKDEPKSRPTTPIQGDPLICFDGGDDLEGYCMVDEKLVPKPVFLRTQSQDSLTRTKNPVLPSIHAEGTLVVPEPKQVRYSAQDPFTLDLGEETPHLAELKGSLFLNDEDNQSYFQPWN